MCRSKGKSPPFLPSLLLTVWTICFQTCFYVKYITHTHTCTQSCYSATNRAAVNILEYIFLCRMDS